MYGSETWTLKKEDENRLLTSAMICLRKILGVTRLDKNKKYNNLEDSRTG